jgi:uncharacterized protein YecE (DUF72 family)
MARLWLGLAVWGFDGWLGSFLPADARPADRLRHFARRMDCVEGNDSFYGVPSAAVLERRRQQSRPGFQFCPKLPRAISHEGLLDDKVEDALAFGRHMKDGLGDRLGPLFLQLPPSLGPDEGPALARLLNPWRRELGHPLLVEVRHPDWFRPQWQARLDHMLERMGMGRVVLDTRPIYQGPGDAQEGNPRKKPALPLHAVRTGPVALVRYISHPQDDANTDTLEEWAERVHQWLDEGTTVYFFVHCPQEQHSPATARRFHELLVERGAPVPPLPWSSLPPEPTQTGLF